MGKIDLLLRWEVLMKRLWIVVTIVLVMAGLPIQYGFGAGPERTDKGKCDCFENGPVTGWDRDSRTVHHRRHEVRLARQLDLTTDQLTLLGDLRKKYFDDTKVQRNELFQKRLELKKLFSDPNADESLIILKSKEVSGIQQKMIDNMIQLRLEERRIFTPEQLKKLADMTHGGRELRKAKPGQ
jgi:Spy/CpxP family protein refolding chaperone